MINKKKIFLASISFSAYEWLPYAVGCLISYAKKNAFINKNYEFLDPGYRSDSLELDSFHESLKQADILGLTNWVWNQNYNDRIAKIYKAYRPDGVVIYGGVNVPENKTVAEDYMTNRPYVDIYFVGPAEETFKNFLINYPNKGLAGHEGTFTPKENNVVKEKTRLTSAPIPSPYLDGTFDKIIVNESRALNALFETNRGCPYACSFCDWGGMTKSKIVRKDKQEVLDTISSIMKYENIERIEIGDANFGIVKEDVEYTLHIIEEKKKRKNDIYLSFGGFAKNGGKYTEEIMRLMNDNFYGHHGRKFVKLSFQSHSDEVLKVAQRSNIKNEKLFPMMKRFQNDGIEIDAEVIIGLPGETEDTWFTTIQQNMDFNINHQKSHPLWVVPNTPIADSEYRKKYKIKTKRIYVPYDLDQYKTKDYHNSRISNKEIKTKCDFTDPSEYQNLEFIYQCYSFDNKKLMKIYDIWFWFNTLYNTKVARKWMLQSSLSAKEQFYKFINLIEAGKMPFFAEKLKEYRYAFWNTIGKDEPITKLESLYLVNILTKFSMRGNEVVDLFLNQSKALSELKLIYPDINFEHFKKIHKDSDLYRMYFVTAEVI